MNYIIRILIILSIYFKPYSQPVLGQMAYNVLGIRRSSPPYKALHSKAVGWNVGEIKLHKGR